MKKFSGWRLAVGGLMLIFALTACMPPDPRKDAQAEKIRQEAEQAALDAEQLRAVNEREEEDAAARSAWWRAVWDDALGAAKVMGKVFVSMVSLSATASLCIVLVFGGWSIKNTVDGVGKAMVIRAELSASLIHMDKETRTFPALFTVSEVDGRRILTVLATGQKLLMDASTNPADPRLIAALAQVTTAGVLADAARSGKADAAGLAMIQPTVIDLEGAVR